MAGAGNEDSPSMTSRPCGPGRSTTWRPSGPRSSSIRHPIPSPMDAGPGRPDDAGHPLVRGLASSTTPRRCSVGPRPSGRRSSRSPSGRAAAGGLVGRARDLGRGRGGRPAPARRRSRGSRRGGRRERPRGGRRAARDRQPRRDLVELLAEFGTQSLIDRFAQIAPRVLIAVDGYAYGGASFDRRAVIDELRAALPDLERTIVLPGPAGPNPIDSATPPTAR